MRRLELAKKRNELERERQRPKTAAPVLASTRRAEEKAQKKGNWWKYASKGGTFGNDLSLISYQPNMPANGD